MPNWCHNTVVFSGSKAKISRIKILVKEMIKQEKQTQKGQLPSFCKSDDGYLFDIRWEEGVLYYLTRWCPNVEVMQAIAEHFIVDFKQEYDEPMMNIYGEYEFKKGFLTELSLDDDDFDQFKINPDNEDTWLFEGKVYESMEEILEILLDRKR